MKTPQVFGPKYLTRKMLVLDLLRNYRIGRFLEVGFGKGDFMLTLSHIGCVGEGVDLSQRAVKDLQDIINQQGLHGRLIARQGDLFEIENDKGYDAVFAFEVLEHIEQDEKAFRKLASLLSPSGVLILSVPAHERFRGLTDDLAGHLRRYERTQIMSLLHENGFKIKTILSYGFPILLLMKRVRDFIDRYCLRILSRMTIRDRTLVSGTCRPYETRFPMLISILNRFLLPIVAATQRVFLNSDIGEGYIVVAQKTELSNADSRAGSPDNQGSASFSSDQLEQILRREIDIGLRRRVRTTLAYLDASPRDHVLDCGCGRGFYLLLLSKLVRCNLYGVDLNRSRLSEGRHHLPPSVHLVRADALSLPFQDSFFDKVVLSEVLEHIEDDRRGLVEAFRVLKVGGVLAITVPHRNYPWLWDPLNKTLNAFGLKPIRHGFWAGIWRYHKRLYEIDELVARVQEAGFHVEDVRRLTQYCLPFSHNLLQAGKTVFECGWLPDKLNRQVNRLRYTDVGASWRNPLGWALAIVDLLDHLNDRVKTYVNHVNIALKARKSTRNFTTFGSY